MFSVGEALQRARLQQGLDVATVASRTKINVRHLEAIEADDRKSLPSSFFYKSFVQQYARFLSLNTKELDTKEIDAEIDRVLSADAPLPLPGQDNTTRREVAPVRVSRRSQRARIYTSSAALILMLVACSGIYIWWHRARSPAPTSKPVVPAAVVTKIKAQPPAPVTVAPVAVAMAATTTMPPQSRPASGNRVLVDLTAREETWLSLSSDGKQVFAGILSPNQTKTVEGKEYAKMRVGNAAGIEVRLNGRPLGPLGHRGQVLIVVFTGDNFQIVTPAKESD